MWRIEASARQKGAVPLEYEALGRKNAPAVRFYQALTAFVIMLEFSD
jgi:hypothetical protein